MREILIIGLLAVTVIGAWLLISSTTISTTSSGVALSERDVILANEMQQLIDFYDDTPTTPHLPDHKYLMLADGTGLFLHFDAPYGQDSKLNWIGTLVPGRFCKADQERVIASYGPGFTHFHQKTTPGTNPAAGHGGVGGEDGYWYRHIAVRNIDGVPWGPVSPGIDSNFMPTSAPDC